MMDITARLRRHPYSWTSVHHEAAQEIERLRAQVSRLRGALEGIEEHGDHADQCPATSYGIHGCLCGYSNAISALAAIREETK
jgi:hypothetical protein